MSFSFLQVMKVCAVVVAYLVFNTSINLFNRYCLGVYGFKFPISVTVCHFGFAFFALTPLMVGFDSYKEQHVEAWKRDWKGFLATGIFTAINVAFNNSSLVYLSLSMNQVITASMPVLTCMFAICIEKNYWPNKFQIIGIVPICVGVMLAVYEEAHNEVLGVVLCSLATLANAVRTALSSHLLSSKLDVFSMTWYTGPVSALVLLPVALYMEASDLVEYAATNMKATIGILGFGSMLALVYNIVLFLTIKTLTGVTMNVMGNVKIIFLLFMSRVVLGELADLDVRLAAGVSLTFGGFFMYSYGTIVKMQPPLAPSIDEENVVNSNSFSRLPQKVEMS
mmetsp:Transcript_22725/g.31686  ORF Transcript_22725/g.31686 Transcript_22725/m.31686 type:complete len:337 (-) Transcript_22725:240-1250(-)|eukprot:CAMPEP_0196580340 /NCGR_PEP_ID=MMETSP1081-20130531/28566_1 /TAXON_ID=36882 /ORGANISM="Pyramimonas amylifera, Strain CCMP720" /LENGTH=336 /DNA_ID=CAMNT_0041900181 /DNA_START=81 /DNA_END=1091 /DNA_ORIENTATION=+